MNIDLLSKMVKELILDNDRVVLPGFGVFTAEIVPASFSGRGNILNPPYRKLHFRAGSESDDMLASIYSRSNSVSMDVARKIVSDFTAELRQVLIRNKTIILPGLGRIRTTKENNFFFVPDADLDIYPEGFGLEPISLKTHMPVSHPFPQVHDTAAHDSSTSETAASVIALPDNQSGEVPAVGASVSVPAGNGNEDASGDEHDGLQPSVQGGVAASAAEYVEEESSESMEVLQEMTAEQMREPESAASVSGVSEKQEKGKQEKGKQEKGLGTESGKSWKSLVSDRRFRTVMLVLAGVLVLAVLAVVIFLVLADLCPDFIDSILYNEAELEILNY